MGVTQLASLLNGGLVGAVVASIEHKEEGTHHHATEDNLKVEEPTENCQARSLNHTLSLAKADTRRFVCGMTCTVQYKYIYLTT